MDAEQTQSVVGLIARTLDVPSGDILMSTTLGELVDDEAQFHEVLSAIGNELDVDLDALQDDDPDEVTVKALIQRIEDLGG